jgi:hypothetical protein
MAVKSGPAGNISESTRIVHLVLLLLAGLLMLAVTTAACGTSSQPSDAQSPDVITPADGGISPIIVNSSFAVGENRFSMLLVDHEDTPVLEAAVSLKFFDLAGDEPVMRSEADARFVPVELAFVDEQSGSESHHAGSNGAYVARVHFDAPGRWAVDVSVSTDSRYVELLPVEIDVLAESPEPAIGDPAPPSRQLTLADVADITEIDSSYPSRPHMHDITIADALSLGRPIVVAFATPAFCQNRTCGPVMDTVMDPLYDQYSDQALFVHVEPLSLQELREGIDRIHVEAALEWGLDTEPWLFVIDRNGRVTAKFEGIVALKEVEGALLLALGEA